MVMIYKKKVLNPSKIYLKFGIGAFGWPMTTSYHPVYIGYPNEGIAEIPPSAIHEIQMKNLSLHRTKHYEQILYIAIKHSQYINFEEI